MQRGYKKFFITGFSGAGKSTLLQELTQFPELADFRLLDLDEVIRKNDAKAYESLGEFIDRVGMERFRSIEKSLLQEFAKTEESLVLALGGGALEKGNQQILGDFKGFFLDTDFETCWKRIEGDSNRPMTKLGKKVLSEVYHERLKSYKAYQKIQSAIEVLDFIREHR